MTLGIILRDFLVAILRGSAKYRKCPSWLRFPSPLAKARFSASNFCELTSRTAGRSPRLLAKPRSLIERSSIGWSAGFLPRMPETLEQLDLLLLTVPTARKVHPDGIRFQGLRYIDTTLAAYIGESVMLRYDPRDAAEVRVFYNDRFLCRAICPELAGAVITLRDVLKARKQRRRGLFAQIRERSKAIDQLLEIKRNDGAESDHHPGTEQIEKKATGPRLKRYHNE